MNTNQLPHMNMETSETGCCPKFDPTGWDKQEFRFENKLFLKAKTKSLMHIPLNMGKVYKRVCSDMMANNAQPKDYYFVLSHAPSSWRGEHLFAVEKEVPGHEHVRLSGTFLSRLFEGPYKNMRFWMKDIEDYAKSQNKKLKKIHCFYTTCPKCAKHWGKNYVVGFAEVE